MVKTNVSLAACVLNGEEKSREINIVDAKPLKTNIPHKELEERMNEINTLEEAKQFEKDNGIDLYISGENKENERAIAQEIDIERENKEILERRRRDMHRRLKGWRGIFMRSFMEGETCCSRRL